MELSPHFTLAEFVRSSLATRKGIDNTPSAATIENLKALCLNVLEPLRASLKKPVRISSGYRSPILNKAVGGSRSSQHMFGLAADIYVDGMSTEELFQYIIHNQIPFDQLIQEFDSWVHISWSDSLRKQKLRATKQDKKTIYTIVE